MGEKEFPTCPFCGNDRIHEKDGKDNRNFKCLGCGRIFQWDGEKLDLIPEDVNHPPHYNNRLMEAIDIIEMIIEIEKNPKVAYNMSNVLKYLLRFRDKGTPVKDLNKAVWYLNRMIRKVEEENESA
jgi:hypothetical protein